MTPGFGRVPSNGPKASPYTSAERASLLRGPPQATPGGPLIGATAKRRHAVAGQAAPCATLAPCRSDAPAPLVPPSFAKPSLKLAPTCGTDVADVVAVGRSGHV